MGTPRGIHHDGDCGQQRSRRLVRVRVRVMVRVRVGVRVRLRVRLRLRLGGRG